MIAEWSGANPDDVVVEPNLNFSGSRMSADTLAKLATAKSLGAPISRATIHSHMVDEGWTEMTFEEEVDAMEAEGPLGGSENHKELEDA